MTGGQEGMQSQSATAQAQAQAQPAAAAAAAAVAKILLDTPSGTPALGFDLTAASRIEELSNQIRSTLRTVRTTFVSGITT